MGPKCGIQVWSSGVGPKFGATTAPHRNGRAEITVPDGDEEGEAENGES